MSDETWELFELITSTHGGKMMYFREGNYIYSRWSHRYMSFDSAVQEFCNMIGE